MVQLLKTQGGSGAARSRRRRLLFVTRAGSFGGTEKHTKELIESLDLSCVSVRVLCLGADPYSEILKSIPNARESVEVCTMGLPRTFREYHALFRRASPDVVVFVSGQHGLFPFAAYAAARLCSARVFGIEHLVAPPLPRELRPGALGFLKARLGWSARRRALESLIGRLCERTICVSGAVQRRLVSCFAITTQQAASRARH